LPGGGFDTGFDVGFDIGTDAAQRLPTWFRGASCEMRPANVTYEMRSSNAQCAARAVNMQFQTRALNIAFGLRMPNLQMPAPLWRPGGQTDMVDRVSGAVYVAPDGDDANSGTEASPVLTLDRASALIDPGGTIYYAGGTHTHLTQQTISRNGTASERITVCPVPGEHAIIDGGGGIDGTSPLVMIDGNYVTFRDIEVQRSSRQGIAIYTATGAEVINCVVRDCWGTGIISEGPTVGSNADTRIEGCTVYHNTAHNLTGEPGYGQGVSLSTGSGGTVRNCFVYENMGEGIGVMKGHGAATLEDNVSYDNYKINIYCDSPSTGTGTRIDGNLCFCTGNPKYLTYNTGLRSTGITFARETGSGHLAGIVCVNNTLVGCHYGISFFEQRPDSGLVDAIFTGNAIINSVTAAMHIEPSGASGNQVTDNIFFPAPVFGGDLSGFIFGPADPQFIAGRGNNAVVWASSEV
jgi:hypothetical protein